MLHETRKTPFYPSFFLSSPTTHSPFSSKKRFLSRNRIFGTVTPPSFTAGRNTGLMPNTFAFDVAEMCTKSRVESDENRMIFDSLVER